MLRVILVDILLFLLPFLAYAGYQLLVRKVDADRFWDEIPILWLIGAGFVMLAIAMVALVSFQGGDPSKTYHPPVYENGQIKPGHID